MENLKVSFKVQFPGRTSAKALIETGIETRLSLALTFHAHSNEMKAIILHKIVEGFHIVITPLVWHESPRHGEWMEDVDPNGKVFNEPKED